MIITYKEEQTQSELSKITETEYFQSLKVPCTSPTICAPGRSDILV